MHVRSEASGTQPASPVPGLSDLSVLARGGYSTVYRARQDSIGREVALKIDTRSLESERDRRRFLREAEAAGRMSGHPNVVNVYDAGVTDDNHPYLVMELCTGGSYASRLRETGPLSPPEVREVGVKIADALQAAHDSGILHRDVKPGNILINRYGVPGLADFGLAALPDPNRELSVTIEALTPAYAPPEVFRMEPPTPLGDQYALAASLYALLSGRPPRWPETGTPSLATMVQILDDPVPDIPGIPMGLSNVLRQAMAAYAEDRYASAAEFRDALAALDLSAGPTTPSTSGPPAYGSPAVGPSTSGPPAYGSPAVGPSTSGPPAYGSPAVGPSTSGNQYRSGYGSPVSGGPVVGAYGRPPTTPSVSGPHGAPGATGWHQGGPPQRPPSPPPAGGGLGAVPAAGPTSVFPANTFGPASLQTRGGYGPPSGPPGDGQGYLAGPPDGPPKRGSGTRRGLVVVGVVTAVLVVAVGIGTAIAAFVHGSDSHPRRSPTSGAAPTVPSTGSSPQTSGSPAPSDGLPDFPFTLPTSTGDWTSSPCAAASFSAGSANIQARCPSAPECWRSQSGSIVRRACVARHTWETYVIATLSTTTRATDAASIQADPNVQSLCTVGVMNALLAVAGQQSTTGWTVKALGPVSTEGTAAREFRCIAGKGTNALTSPIFVK